MKEVGVGLEKDSFKVIMIEGVIEAQVIVDLRSGSRVSINRDRIRCYKCRKYDHFAKDCPTSKIKKETDQIQQMYNMDEEKTSLKMLATDTYDMSQQNKFSR